MSELYAMLTQEMGYAPDYVLDKMQWYEINAAMEYSHYSVKDGWEQARLIAYMVAQVNSKHTLKMEDIVKFPWEDDDEDTAKTTITKEEIEQLQKDAENYIKHMNKQIEKRDTTNG